MKKTASQPKVRTARKRATEPKARGADGKSAPGSIVDPHVNELRDQAERAKAKGELERAIKLLTEALVIGNLPYEIEFELLKQRGVCSNWAGNNAGYTADARAMFLLAQENQDIGRQAAALVPWVDGASNTGSGAIREVAHLAEQIAPETKDAHVQADCLFVRAYSSWVNNQLQQTEQQFQDAVGLYQQSGDRSAEAFGWQHLSGAYQFMGKADQGRRAAQEGLSIYRELGDRFGETRCLNSMAIVAKDYAERRAYMEQILLLAQELGMRRTVITTYNNISLLYTNMGLYSTARRYVELAVNDIRERGTEQFTLATYLESLGRVYAAQGDHDRAFNAFEESADIFRENELPAYVALCVCGKGNVELARGREPEALKHFEDAMELLKGKDYPVEELVALNGLGAAYLAIGDLDSADRYTQQAIGLLASTNDVSFEYPPQEIWWGRYRVLKAKSRKAGRRTKSARAQVDEEMWRALDNARKMMLSNITELTDNGLRRNYFNKVAVNRSVVTEWTRSALARGIPIEQATTRVGSLQEQFRRLISIGVRMNEVREVDALFDLLMEQLIELSGAERALLVLAGDDGRLSVAGARGYQGGEEREALTEINSFLDEVTHKQSAVLSERESDAEGVPTTLSQMGIPLIEQRRLIGIIYAENHALFGAFTQTDIDLVSAFANQTASAIENARLYHGLEQRVKERTEELNQRVDELAILNSVGEAMAKTLDVRTVTRIVGDKVRDIFDSESVTIMLLDAKTQLIHTHYEYDKGEGGYVEYIEPFPLGKGLTSGVIQSQKPLMLGTVEEQVAQGAYIPPEMIEKSSGVISQSTLMVPIIVGEKTIGIVGMGSYRQNAFNENHKKLLQTLSANMGIAIQNARLFEAEQERVAELEIINSIQKGLAAELDFQAIVDLVGDKLRQVFDTPDLAINWYDEKANLIHYLYAYEHGERLNLLPTPPTRGGSFERMAKTRQPLVLNSVAEMANMNALAMPGTDQSQSTVRVPIISSDRVLGVIGIENYERENAFGESELRLLTTIAASLGTALENARLFDEAQRLLKETEQRNAELAIINSVQAALAAELNIQGIYDAVGDKIRGIFDNKDVGIRIYDAKTNLMHYPYAYENGERVSIDSHTLAPRGFGYQVIRTREPLIINEKLGEESEKYGSYTLPGTQKPKACVMVPLVAGDQARGLIDIVDMEHEHAFSDSDVRLLQTLANSMSVALENARLFDETQRLLKETEQRAQELAIINSVQAALAAELNIQGIYDAVGDKIREIFHNTDTGIRIYDPKTNLVHFPYLYEHGERVSIDSMPLGVGGFGAHVLQTRETLVINENIEEQVPRYGSFPLPGTRVEKSMVMVPLVAGDQARGLIALVDMEKEHAFSDSDVRLLQTLANAMSVALENARLFDETQRLLKETEQRNAELAIINSVQAALAAELNIQGIYDAVGDKIREIFDHKDVGIRIYDAKTNLVHYPYTYENGERLEIGSEPLTEKGITAHVLQTRETLVLDENIATEAAKYGAILLAGTQLPKSQIFVPLVTGNQARGIIDLVDMEREHAFGDSDVRLLQTLANSMSVALENARLFDETQRLLKETEQRAQELGIINSVQAGLASKLEMQAIYDLVGDKIRDIFDAQAVILATYDKDSNFLHFPYLFEKGERYVQEPVQMDGTGVLDHVIMKRQPIIINSDIGRRTAELTGNPGITLGEGVATKSRIDVPMMVGGEAHGAISLQNVDHENAFTESDLRLLQTLANSMSVALENARLFDETQRLLQETEQRAAELAIINSVQQGLASKLDMQAIYQLVGDKVREIFHADTTYIMSYDDKDSSVFSHYYVERGNYLTPVRVEFGRGLYTQVIRTRAPIVLGSDKEAKGLGVVSIPSPGSKEDLNKSFLGVPILLGKQVTGVLSVQSYKENAFTEADVRLLQTLANSMSVALENARLLDETTRRANEMTALTDTGREISASLDLNTVLERVTQNAQRVLQAGTSAVFLIEPDGQTLRAISAVGATADAVMAFRPRLGQGLIGSIARTGVAEAIADTTLDPRTVHLPGTTPTAKGEKLMVAPLFSSNRVSGVIAVWRDADAEAFTAQDLTFVDGMARQAGIAIQNARLFDEAQRLLEETNQRAAELALINSIQQGLATKLDFHAIIELVGNKFHEIFSAESLMISLYDAAENRIDHEYLVERGKRFPPVSETPPDALRMEIVRTREPLFINENYAERCAELGMRMAIVGEAPKSWLSIPILNGDQVIGIISLQNLDRERAFDDAVVRLLTTVALSMSVALQNARLFDETTRRANEMTALTEIGREISATLDLNAVLEQIATRAQQVLHARDVSIRLLEPDGSLPTVVAIGKYAELNKKDVLHLGEGITGHIALTGVAEIVNDPLNDPRAQDLPGTEEDEPNEVILFAPLILRGQVTGVMVLWRDRDQSGPFVQGDLDFIVGLSRQAAIAIQNARLFDESLHLLEEAKLARESAEAANRTKSTFLANMSHELRTPLNAIIGYSEMLTEEAQDSGQKQMVPDLEKINVAGKHLLDLINAILDLSKIEAGKMDLYLETFEVKKMVGDVVAVIQPLVAKNHNTLQVNVPEDAGSMRADLTKVRQSLFNLLSNAAKFTENGEITLTVQVEKDGRSGRGEAIAGRGDAPRIRFSVHDTGIGMNAEQSEKLFQEFTQADASTSRKYGGTGLGLALSRRFCRLMGGDILVESASGKGSTFTIVLPTEVVDPRAESLPVELLPTQTVSPNAKKVVVVDDEPTARDLLERLLRAEGFQVFPAASGQDGLRLARTLHPDLITLDVMMPGVDGWAVLTELKADPRTADIPVIVLSILDDKNLGFALGATDYLTKPIDRERLITILERYHENGNARHALVIEDDAATREMLGRMLEKEGWSVNRAANGRIALEKLRELVPQLILLDLMMPEMDGFEFVTELRQHPEWRGVPIIVVTAKDLTPEDRLRLNGYVEKILQKSGNSRDELLAQVRDLVKALADKREPRGTIRTP